MIADHLTKSDYDEVAKQIMQNMQLDNGYGHFEGVSYPKKWIEKISKAAQSFFDANPDKFTDEDIENLSCGCYDENVDTYGNLVGYNELDKVLNEYFDEGMGTGIVEEKPRLMHTYKKRKGDHRQ